MNDVWKDENIWWKIGCCCPFIANCVWPVLSDRYSSDTQSKETHSSLSLLLHTHSANNNTHTQKVVLVAMNNSCPRPNFLSSTQHSRQAALYTFIVLFFSL